MPGAEAPARGADKARPAAPTLGAADPGDGPSPEQRKRFLDQVKDDPEALARRKGFLERIDQRDPQALERWHRMMDRRREGGGAPAAQ